MLAMGGVLQLQSSEIFIPFGDGLTTNGILGLITVGSTSNILFICKIEIWKSPLMFTERIELDNAKKTSREACKI